MKTQEKSEISHYVALEHFCTEDHSLSVEPGDPISVEEWEGLSHLFGQGYFEPVYKNEMESKEAV